MTALDTSVLLLPHNDTLVSKKPKISETNSKINVNTEILVSQRIITQSFWNTVTSDRDTELILNNVCATACALSKDVRCQLYCCTPLIWHSPKHHSEHWVCAQPPRVQRCTSANSKYQVREHDIALWSQVRLFMKAALTIYSYNEALVTRHLKKITSCSRTSPINK